MKDCVKGRDQSFVKGIKLYRRYYRTIHTLEGNISQISLFASLDLFKKDATLRTGQMYV